MGYKVISVAEEDKDAGQRTIFPLGAFRREVSKENGRLGRALTFLVLIGAILKAFRGKNLATAPSGSSNEKRSPGMANESAAATSRRRIDEDENRSILSTLLEQNGSVESESDDLFERAATSSREEFRRTYESEVRGLKGFRSSIFGLW